MLVNLFYLCYFWFYGNLKRCLVCFADDCIKNNHFKHLLIQLQLGIVLVWWAPTCYICDTSVKQSVFVYLFPRLRAKHGNDWAAIGVALGRSASSVKDKCRLMKDNCKSGMKKIIVDSKVIRQAQLQAAIESINA